MNKAEKAYKTLNEIEELASGNSLIHKLDALSKLLITIIYILFVMSFPRYNFSYLLIMALYPYIMFKLSNHSILKAIYKMRFILPLIIFVGIFNPIFDKRPFISFITYGWLAFFVMILKGLLTLLASYSLISTTKIDDICAALRSIRVPEILVTNILLTYRYISVLIKEVSTMLNAYKLRAPKEKGIVYKAWGSFIGSLILRSMDKAKEIYEAMELRGFNGEFYYAKKTKIKRIDLLFITITILFFIISRRYPILTMIGNIFVG